MATPAQGITFTGLPGGLTNVKVSKTGIDTTANQLDASTLDLAEGSDRVYVDGLPDPGAMKNTVTATFFGTPPTAGDTCTIDGLEYTCTNVEIDHQVGELVKGTATYVWVPD